MGSSNWSAKHYTARRAEEKTSGKSSFAHHDNIVKGNVVAGVHTSLDPANMKDGYRECRDSAEHPNSMPIFIGLDVTGSMRSVPGIVQSKLPELMGLLIRKNYVEDPSICMSGIGDAEMHDKAPFQVGQFEAGIEIDDDIGHLYLEGNGGGNSQESYDIALYFLARCVKSDAWEKRNTKGYAFIICDEKLPTKCLALSVKKVFNQDIQGDIPIDQLMQEVLEKWNLICICPNMTQHYNTSYQAGWKKYLGQNMIYLDDAAAITETIASCIGVCEDIDLSTITNDLKEVGLSTNSINAVSRAMSTITPSSISKVNLSSTGLTTL